MAGEHPPTLDRYVQQDIGSALREAGADGVENDLPADIERLLETLKSREHDAE